MNKKIYVGVVALLMMTAGIATAYDENNPIFITLRWIVPSDTTFLVSIRGATETIDFTPASKNENLTEPDNQVAASSLPILNVSNIGNTALDLWHNASSPSFATLMAGTTNDEEASVTLSGSMLQFSDELAIDAHVDVYMWSNVTDAIAGTSLGNYSINATTD